MSNKHVFNQELADYYERRLQELSLQMVDNLAAKKQAYAEYHQLRTVESYNAYSRAADQYSNTEYDFNEIVNKYADYIDSYATV